MTRSPPPKGDLPQDVIELAIRDPEEHGARSAFAKLYRHYEHRVQHAVVKAGLKTAYLRGPDSQERRDDLTQEIWKRFLEKPELLQWYKPPRGPFGGFIWRVAYQQALYCLHRRGWGPCTGYDLVIGEGDWDLALRLIQSDLFARFVELAKSELDEVDWMLIEEHHIAGETLRALAVKHGRSEDALQKRNKKLLAKIVRIVAKLHQPPPVRPTVALLLLILGGLG